MKTPKEIELQKYIEQHIDDEPELLRELTRQAHIRLLHPRMISGHIQGRILTMCMRMIQPSRVLEIGTYTGYSALCIAEGLSDAAMLDTIEINDELEEYIQSFFNKSEHGHKITLHIGDGLQLIPQFPYMFDVIFIDGNKRHYVEYYEASLSKLSAGGFIFADNTLWDGHVIDAHIDANDYQTKGILAFNDYVKRDTRVETAIFPIRDGLTILRKK
ncbi:MAG TPA: O-methyltransferase [Bacteroidales bacterium]|nr:MAG: putative O-methyltransferase [Bacteroidetes bacterium ADurb.Bin217]HOS84366.1 O-methyltransferase [Bacteroidales bacterium]HPH15657.1 O-methyltransferase [Bacteroidales bacterium]